MLAFTTMQGSNSRVQPMPRQPRVVPESCGSGQTQRPIHLFKELYLFFFFKKKTTLFLKTGSHIQIASGILELSVQTRLKAHTNLPAFAFKVLGLKAWATLCGDLEASNFLDDTWGCSVKGLAGHQRAIHSVQGFLPFSLSFPLSNRNTSRHPEQQNESFASPRACVRSPTSSVPFSPSECLRLYTHILTEVRGHQVSPVIALHVLC